MSVAYFFHTMRLTLNCLQPKCEVIIIFLSLKQDDADKALERRMTNTLNEDETKCVFCKSINRSSEGICQ